jgi:DNA polymerase V
MTDYIIDEKRCDNKLQLAQSTIAAGFPKPSDDYILARLDLTELIVKHPSATYLARVEGNSMIELGIFSGDLLVVDRAAERIHMCVVVASIDGEFTTKILDVHNQLLLPANKDMAPIAIPEDADVMFEGVVISVIKTNVSGYDCAY